MIKVLFHNISSNPVITYRICSSANIFTLAESKTKGAEGLRGRRDYEDKGPQGDEKKVCKLDGSQKK